MPLSPNFDQLDPETQDSLTSYIDQGIAEKRIGSNLRAILLERTATQILDNRNLSVPTGEQYERILQSQSPSAVERLHEERADTSHHGGGCSK